MSSFGHAGLFVCFARFDLLCANAAEIYPELAARGIVPDLVTEQTSAHDPLNGYVPAGLTLEEAAELRKEDPEGYVERAKASMAEEVEAMLAFQRAGAEVFDYGNNIRACAKEAGCARAFDVVGFVPLYIRPLFCEGKGPFRWVALSGDPDTAVFHMGKRINGADAYANKFRDRMTQLISLLAT